MKTSLINFIAIVILLLGALTLFSPTQPEAAAATMTVQAEDDKNCCKASETGAECCHEKKGCRANATQCCTYNWLGFCWLGDS